jgi:hypothetical protein
LLEQASDEETARDTAKDFSSHRAVTDLCCGAGTDAIAMAKQGLQVNAVDRCPIACRLTQRNAERQQANLAVSQLNAEDLAIDPSTYIHIDPDRRADGSRTTSLARLSPSWLAIDGMLKSCAGMSLKLAPGLRIERSSLEQQVDRPPDAIRFISKDGSVRQQRWYWGLERWPSDSITCSMHLHGSTKETHGGDWIHETFQMPNHAESTTSDVIVNEVRGFVADYDPSLRAADCAASFAARYNWHLLGSTHGYVTAGSIKEHPMVRWFRVMDVLPLDRKKLKVYSKQAQVRNWELKSRGIDIDLDAMRSLLASDRASKCQRSILFTQWDGHHRAVICEEIQRA